MKVARINMYLLCQHSARHIQSLPRGFYICTKGFKARTVFNFCHSTSPTYILYFIVCTWNDLICTSPTFYSSVQNQTSARVSSGAHFTFAVRFFCTPVATIQCFYGIILQIGLKWNSLLFGQLARLSALYMPADILLDSCAAVEHIP